jgi:hypothetical protein
MIRAELKTLSSDSLSRPSLPENEAECAVSMVASIGPVGDGAAELFYFDVVTPAYLASAQASRWGRGLLAVPEFSWSAVERAVEKLISHATGNTWAEISSKLSQELVSEYASYQRHAG